MPVEAPDQQPRKGYRVRRISKLIDIEVHTLALLVQILRTSVYGPAVNIGDLLDSFLFLLPCNLSFNHQFLLEVIFQVVLILIFGHLKSDTDCLVSKLVPC